MANQAHMSVLDLQLIDVNTDHEDAIRTQVANVARHVGQGPLSNATIGVCINTAES